MKRTFVLFLSILICSSLAFASLSPRSSFSEEISIVQYNRTWVSPTKSIYTVESLTANPTVVNELDIMFTKNFGLSFGLGLGYEIPIYDNNRFVTVPKNFNGTLDSGIVLSFKNFRVALLAALRSSFETARNSWISQVGGIFDISYRLDNGLLFQSGVKYFYSYKVRTFALSFGIGYGFGGKK